MTQGEGTWREIVGVVGDVRQDGLMADVSAQGGMRLTALGIALGLAAALAVSRVLGGVMAELLFQISTTDPVPSASCPC